MAPHRGRRRSAGELNAAAEPSADVEAWSLTDVKAATDSAFTPLLSADLVFCMSWTMFGALPAALSEIAVAGLDGGYFVFDPGGLADRSADEGDRLFAALTELADSYDVILAANGDEVNSLTEAVTGGVPESADVEDSLDRLREAADLAAAVVHEAEAAVAATSNGRVRVENLEVDPVRRVGGDDRFDAGLGHALVRGWSWEDALRLGNACASRYVATGESAFLRRHE